MTKNRVLYEGALTADDRRAINQNFADVSLCNTQLDKNLDTTLADIPGMITETLAAGTYRYRVNLGVSAGASGGTKVAFKQGTASMLTSIQNTGRGLTASAVAVQNVTSTTDQASLFAATAAHVNVELTGVVVLALPGTLQLQAAQNASNGTNTSILVNSVMEFTQIV